MNNATLVCDKTITRLINRAANLIYKSELKGEQHQTIKVSLPVTPSSVPEYYALNSFAQRQEYHARLEQFIQDGSIEVQWDRNAGDRGQLERVFLIAPQRAAQRLEIQLPWEISQQAINALLPFKCLELPKIEEICNTWRIGKSVGGVTADKAQQFVDAAKVIMHCFAKDTSRKDILLRRLSTGLFNDSKRIEAIESQLNFLVGLDNLSENEDVFAELGLVKHPQPMLIGGGANLSVVTGGGTSNILYPYIGLRPDKLHYIESPGQKITKVLTIENLATFNEVVEYGENPKDLLII